MQKHTQTNTKFNEITLTVSNLINMNNSKSYSTPLNKLSKQYRFMLPNKNKDKSDHVHGMLIQDKP